MALNVDFVPVEVSLINSYQIPKLKSILSNEISKIKVSEIYKNWLLF